MSAALRAMDSGGSDRGVRVIVVGRTALAGVDAVLRRQRGVELIRASTPFAAIGEAASPIGEDSPEDLTVIVSPEALPAERSAAFAAAVRRIDERARLLCLGERLLPGFDGVLDVGGDGASTMSQVLHTRPTAEPTPSAQPAPSAPSDVPAPAPASPAPAAVQVLVPANPAAALASGRDPVVAALEALKARWNLSEARVAPGGGEGAAVTFNGREVGRLITRPALPDAAVEREAAELAPWIVLARQQEQLRHAAFTDELTGAWNRRYFNRFLSAAIADATEKRHTVTLLVFDVDNFKSYNDRFGHTAGDEILVETVRLLNGSIRATDRVCRVGGDEFAVIFHDPAGPRGAGASGTAATPMVSGGGATSPQSISEVVRRFQRAICEHRFPKLAELAPGTLTISGGMATFPWDGRTVQQLLDKADALALRSKQEGKNKVAFGPGAEQVCGQ